MEGHQASHGPAVMSTRGPRSVLGFEKHVRLSWRWIGWTGLPRVCCSEVTRKQDSCPRRHSADAADAGPLPKALGSERWAQVKVGYRETLRSGRGPGSCCCTDVHHVTEKRDVPPMDISRERPSTRRGPGRASAPPAGCASAWLSGLRGRRSLRGSVAAIPNQPPSPVCLPRPQSALCPRRPPPPPWGAGAWSLPGARSAARALPRGRGLAPPRDASALAVPTLASRRVSVPQGPTPPRPREEFRVARFSGRFTSGENFSENVHFCKCSFLNTEHFRWGP